MKKTLTILLVVVIGAGLFGWWKVSSGPKVHKETRFMMDTYVTIYVLGSRQSALLAMKEAFDRMQEIDRKFNPYDKDSPVYAFNNKNVPITDPEVLSVIKDAWGVYEKSRGAFDITTLSLTELWGFNTGSPHLPEQAMINGALKNCGFSQLVIEGDKISKKNPDVHLGMGAIAKGYAVNQAVRVLKANGISAAIVDAGGDVYALGKKGRVLWKVGIRDPKAKDILGYLEVEDLAVVGSGDYERFFIDNGKKYHHIFDPKTGYPAQGLTSVTVVYPDAEFADAWATALFVLGPEKGMDTVKTIPGMEVIMITSEGQILYSPGLEKGLKHIKRRGYE